MTRLQPLDPPYDPELARTLERMMPPGVPPLNLFRTVAHNRHVLDKMRSTGAYLLNFGTLEPAEREFVIQHVCRRCGCDYEHDVHVAFFGAAERDRLLERLVDELHDTSKLSDELWSELAERYRPEQLVELIALCGQYHLVSYLANALGVEAEAA